MIKFERHSNQHNIVKVENQKIDMNTIFSCDTLKYDFCAWDNTVSSCDTLQLVQYEFCPGTNTIFSSNPIQILFFHISQGALSIYWES